MSELRQDPTTREWVIMAPERARRTHDFPKQRPGNDLPEFSPSCPFCPGNEIMTPLEITYYRLQTDDGWQVRVFANKYPALRNEGPLLENSENDLFHSVSGLGAHEVVVETPKHNRPLALMEDDEVTTVLLAYRDRYNALSQNPNLKSIVIFKNHGPGAGTSIEHPHSQIIATPVVPEHIKTRMKVARSYFRSTGRCLYSGIVEQELAIGKRVVIETDEFVIFQPFASYQPFETWIVPKTNQASFGSTSDDDLKHLAHLLRITLLGLYQGLDNPDYNYIIDCAPIAEANNDYYRWHLRIVPRINETAGFEIGSGMRINTALPEETARIMRGLKIW